MAVTFPTDLEIAREARLKPMPDIAKRMGIDPHLLEPYGHDVAKVKLQALDELKDRPKAKYVVVSAITPTPPGPIATCVGGTRIPLTRSSLRAMASRRGMMPAVGV